MQLGDDDTLGTVDHERAGGRHERNFAHINLLFLHFLDFLVVGFTVENDQAHLGAQRRSERQAALLTFLHVEGGLAKLVLDELEARTPRM